MSYRREDYIKVNELLAERRQRAESDASRRREDIYKKLPEIRNIDRKLAMTAANVIDIIGGGPEAVKLGMAKIEAENLALQARRAEIMRAAGYPEDYTEPQYTCEKCHDTGFVGTEACVCRRRALVLAGYESSGIGALLGKQTFETFSSGYNSDSPSILLAYERMKSYAEDFSGVGDGNLLLVGKTGLGKTHLSTAVAGVVIERGFDVKYETAQNMISDFATWQFHRKNGDEDPTERYFECDLLIIDDLGCELTNDFTVSCLYNLINTRINRGRGMIINTNLSPADLRRRYDSRITSRLFGEFSALLFEGRDVRAERLRGNAQK